MFDQSYWLEIDADKTEVRLQDELLQLVKDNIQQSDKRPLSTLW